jgi:NAD(P)-dependent dehydrogenase (short-subunit alcohol dehydrogenase family)
MPDLQRAVVTGSSSGIGAAIAADLVAGGVRVLGVDLTANPRLETLHVDLAETAKLPSVVAEAVERLGGVEILVNCAGISHPQAAVDLSWDAYDQTLRVNLHAPVFLMSLFGASMAANRYGRIVNITSIHGRLSEPLSLAYDVSKGGLESATRTFAVELADQGVIVNAIAPGFVATPLSVVDGMNELESDWFQNIYVKAARLPIRRAADPHEIAKHVTFLCSADNTYLTGQVVTVDGGLSASF